MELEREDIKGKILYKLCRGGSGRHLSEHDMLTGFPRSDVGTIKIILDEMVKERLIYSKPTQFGPQYFVNQGKKKEVLDLIEKFKSKKFDA